MAVGQLSRNIDALEMTWPLQEQREIGFPVRVSGRIDLEHRELCLRTEAFVQKLVSHPSG